MYKDWLSNRVDPDETAHMSRLIWIYAVCKKPIVIAYGCVKVEQIKKINKICENINTRIMFKENFSL